MNNYEPNINNLTALWKVVSSFFPNNFNDQYLECAYIEDSQWPNRIWAKKPLSISHFEETKENLGGIVTNQAAGINSLGIIPQKRKQGFATEIMYHILNKSIDQNLS